MNLKVTIFPQVSKYTISGPPKPFKQVSTDYIISSQTPNTFQRIQIQILRLLQIAIAISRRKGKNASIGLFLNPMRFFIFEAQKEKKGGTENKKTRKLFKQIRHFMFGIVNTWNNFTEQTF